MKLLPNRPQWVTGMMPLLEELTLLMPAFGIKHHHSLHYFWRAGSLHTIFQSLVWRTDLVSSIAQTAHLQTVRRLKDSDVLAGLLPPPPLPSPPSRAYSGVILDGLFRREPSGMFLHLGTSVVTLPQFCRRVSSFWERSKNTFWLQRESISAL